MMWTKRKKVRAVVRTLAVILMFSWSTVLHAFAADGYWIKDSIGWWYNTGGSYPVRQWKRIDGFWYYFDNVGYMLENSYTPDGYYVNSDGVWIPNYDRVRIGERVEIEGTNYTTGELVLEDIIRNDETTVIYEEVKGYRSTGNFLRLGRIKAGEGNPQNNLVYAGLDNIFFGTLDRSFHVGYGGQGIRLVFIGEDGERLEIEWYGQEALDYPKVYGSEKIAGLLGDYYAWYSREMVK